jgi:hypothetical protein
VKSASLEALNYVEGKRELRLTAEFTEWLGALPPETINRVAAGLNRVLNGGPTLGRPDVDLIKGSRHHNMKELRVGTSVRALFVFDQRDPLMLIGGDKRGAWNNWYARTIRDADRLYDQHRRDNGKGGSPRRRDPPGRGR